MWADIRLLSAGGHVSFSQNNIFAVNMFFLNGWLQWFTNTHLSFILVLSTKVPKDVEHTAK